jgi:hypothetical protein
MAAFRPGDEVRWEMGNRFGRRWFDGRLTRRHPVEWPDSDWALTITGLGTLYDDEPAMLGREVDVLARHLTLRRRPVSWWTVAALLAFVLLCAAFSVASFLTGSTPAGWLFCVATGFCVGCVTSEIRAKLTKPKDKPKERNR